MATTWITGISTDENRLSWTVLRRGKDSWEVFAQHSVPFSESPEEEEAGATAPSAAAWKALAKQMRGKICLTLPTRQALLRTALLPSIDGEELRGMAELQVEKFSPIPEDQAVLGLETPEVSEDSALLTMAVSPRENLEALGQLFQAQKILPDSVDVESLGWWSALGRAGHIPAHDTCLFFLSSASHTEMILSRAGAPILFASLPGRPKEAPEDALREWAAEMADEVDYLLTTAEADWGGLGKPSAMVFSSDRESGDMLLSQLSVHLGGLSSSSANLLSELPPLSESIARRHAAPPTPLAMDLSLTEWREADKTRRLHRSLIRAGSVFAFLWVAAAIAFGTMLQMERSKIGKLETQVLSREEPALDVRRIRGKLREWNLFADRTHSALECLREVATVMPPGVELTMFTYRKGTNVTLRGEASQTDPIYGFIQNLEKSDLFTTVSAEGGISTRQLERRGTIHTFGVAIALPSASTDELQAFGSTTE